MAVAIVLARSLRATWVASNIFSHFPNLQTNMHLYPHTLAFISTLSDTPVPPCLARMQDTKTPEEIYNRHLSWLRL